MNLLSWLLGGGKHPQVTQEAPEKKREGQCEVIGCNNCAKVLITRGDEKRWVCKRCAEELVGDQGWSYEKFPLEW